MNKTITKTQAKNFLKRKGVKNPIESEIQDYIDFEKGLIPAYCIATEKNGRTTIETIATTEFKEILTEELRKHGY